MSYDQCCGSGQYDALAKDVLKNSEDVFQVKQDEAEQNARLDVAEQDIQSNTDAIQAISGSIEIKSFLTTRLNGVGIALPANISTELEFTKQIESDPDVMSYDTILNVFKFSEGIVGLYTSCQFGTALTGLATNGTIRLIDLSTGLPIAEDVFSIPQGSNNYVVYPQALIEFDATQATKDYRVEIEVDRAIQLKEVRNIFEKSLTTEFPTTGLQVADPATESLSGVAVDQQEANREVVEKLSKSTDQLLLYDFNDKPLNITQGDTFDFGDTLILDHNIIDIENYMILIMFKQNPTTDKKFVTFTLSPFSTRIVSSAVARTGTNIFEISAYFTYDEGNKNLVYVNNTRYGKLISELSWTSVDIDNVGSANVYRIVAFKIK